MQKKLIALAIAGLASSAAFAQTNVTIYGIVDAGVAYSFDGGNANNNGNGGRDSQFNVISNGLSGSRLGFKGVEDLGNGLKALFTLEYSVTMDTAGALDNARQQFVGLTGGFGTAVIGRLQTTGYDFSCAAGPLPGSALNAMDKVSVNVTLNCGGLGRANNAIAYISPSFGGVTFAINHARVTEAAGAPGQGNPDAYATLLSASYKNGGLDAGVVYSKYNGSHIDVTALGTLPVFGANTSFVDAAEYGIRASYDFGVAKVFGSWQGLEVTSGVNDPADKLNQSWQAAVAVPVGKHTFIAQYAGNQVKATTAADNTAAYTLAYTYSLSKRTTAYAGYTFVENENGANRAAGFNGGTPNLTVAGASSQVVAAGLRHSF
ncbi:porin [Azonexus sp. R2A61]|uniref:porin n=1 Tax=Azonexus sp. R2A61 TaxID=2744443 RepID=UPI001F4065C6|nr:porin [Azonexus sp. R2A61]